MRKILQSVAAGRLGQIIRASAFGLIGILLLSDSTSISIAHATKSPGKPVSGATPAEFVILVVLEGVDHQAVSAGPMPVLSRLAEEGSVTWSAVSPTPQLRLPTMASIVTGLPIEKHGITWDRFDFSRGYPRAPTLFDYMDLGGGKDTAIFFMDESMYQLARPEPYIDYQVCGALRPECTASQVVKYIRDYMVKGASGEGYGRRILDLPHLLLVHFPEPSRVGAARGWRSEEYRQALRDVDHAVQSTIEIYRDLEFLDRTTLFVMAINGGATPSSGDEGQEPARVPWIAWGHGVRAGHQITQPVSLLDTGATVMRTLGVETYTEWDSHAVEEVFQATQTVKAGRAGKHAHAP